MGIPVGYNKSVDSLGVLIFELVSGKTPFRDWAVKNLYSSRIRIPNMNNIAFEFLHKCDIIGQQVIARFIKGK